MRIAILDPPRAPITPFAQEGHALLSFEIEPDEVE
jgi:hypothetical protein